MIKVKLISYTIEGERLVAAAAKQSLSRKPFVHAWRGMSDEEVEAWIKETFRRGHFSPWEHSTYTFIVEGISRICSHQLVRHRVASYTQLSQRLSVGASKKREAQLDHIGAKLVLDREENDKWYVKVVAPNGAVLGEAILYNPPIFDKVEVVSAATNDVKEVLEDAPWYLGFYGVSIPPTIRGEARRKYLEVARQAYRTYMELVELGIPPEDARFILPQGVKTKVIVTMNARELLTSFLPLRMCRRAQWEIRAVAWKLHHELLAVHPKLFKWAGPRCLLHENMARKDPITLEDLLTGKADLTIERCPEGKPRKAIPECVQEALQEVLQAIS